jgi:hypothetical protein
MGDGTGGGTVALVGALVGGLTCWAETLLTAVAARNRLHKAGRTCIVAFVGSTEVGSSLSWIVYGFSRQQHQQAKLPLFH